MTFRVEGTDGLTARLEAVRKSPRKLLGRLALKAVAEQKRLVPRKTGNLGRTIRLGRVTSTYAETVAGANYAAHVEYGTGPHIIRPRRAKALRFATGGGATLSGRPRKGAPVVFARFVRHPGTKAQPFMEPGARKAVESGSVDEIIAAWNKAD